MIGLRRQGSDRMRGDEAVDSVEPVVLAESLAVFGERNGELGL